MKNLFKISSILILLSLFSCVKNINSDKKHDNLKAALHFKFNPIIDKLLIDYINNNNKYEDFKLISCKTKHPTLKNLDEGNAEIANRAEFILGPAYETEKKPLFYIEFRGKRLWISDGLEYISKLSETNLPKFILPDDSIKIDNNIYNKSSEIIFIKKAIYFMVNKNDSIIINYRPDTLFIPRQSTIKAVKFR